MKKNKLLLSIALLLGSMSASAQWDSEVSQQLTPKELMPLFEVQTNSDGLTYVGFMDLVLEDPERQGNRYSDGLDVAYYLQILDREGNKLLLGTGKLVSLEPTRSFTTGDDRIIFADSDGNLIYIVKDERNWNDGSYPNQSYFAYKLSPTGEFLWEEPVDLDKGTAYYGVYNIKVIETAGGYVFAHEIRTSNSGTPYLEIDKVSKTGELLWETPLTISGAAFPFLVNSDDDDFILVYSIGAPLYAQRYTSDKEPVWESPTTIYSSGYTSGQSPFTAVRVYPDQKDGVFVTWFDDRDRDNYESCYVSHLLPTGEQGFVTSSGEGLKLSYNPNMRAFLPSLCYDPEGEILYAAFEEHNSGQTYRSIILQKVSKEGEWLWTGTPGQTSTIGIVLDNATQQSFGDYSIRLAGKGKIAVFYSHNPSSISSENIFALLDVSGEQPAYLLESERQVFEGPEAGAKSGLTVLPLRDKSWFPVFWSDYRGSTLDDGPAIYARKVNLPLSTGLNAIGVNASLATTGLNVTLSGHTLSILNAKGARIDRVRLYAADGSLRQDFPVQSTGNVLIPISATPKIAIVEVVANGTKAVFKVVTSDE